MAVIEQQTEAAPPMARDESVQGPQSAVLHSAGAIKSTGEGGSLARKRYQKGFSDRAKLGRAIPGEFSGLER